LSATSNFALLDPFAPGVNTTLIPQLPPAASDVPQLLVCVKSVGFVPAKLIPLIVNATVPGFVKVTVCAVLATPVGWLPKGSEVGKT
jgi:hypothetical protein